MAKYLTSNRVKNSQPAIEVCDNGAFACVPFEFTVEAALEVNDVIGLVKLPAENVGVDVLLDCPDLDTGGSPAIVLNVGLFENDGVDGGALPTAVDADAYIDASNVGQAGGLSRMDAVAGLSIAPHDTNERVVGLQVETAPQTGATGVTLRGWFQYRTAYDGK